MGGWWERDDGKGGEMVRERPERGDGERETEES